MVIDTLKGVIILWRNPNKTVMVETKKENVNETSALPPEPLKTVGDALKNGDEPQPEDDKPDVEKLIAEAEQRGYLRGVNEQIEKRMAQPGLLEIATDDTDTQASSRQCRILNVVRPCIWDL